MSLIYRPAFQQKVQSLQFMRTWQVGRFQSPKGVRFIALDGSMHFVHHGDIENWKGRVPMDDLPPGDSEPAWRVEAEQP